MGRIVTYQDFVDFGDSDEQRIAAIKQLIYQHKSSEFCKTAQIADLYDAQKNKTIMEAAPILYALNGMKAIDYTASNHQIASNFFRQLNKQRTTYSLGNGVTFTRDGVKEKLGKDFDTDISNAAYLALIHGVCYVFLDVDHLHRFPAYQFAPLWDERNSALRAGVRYWRIDDNHPGYAVLYEEDGFTVYKAERGDDYKIDQPKRAYKLTVQKAAIDDEETIVGGENYSGLPIVPLWGSDLHQSTLVGMRGAIDAYDLVCSDFANDLSECSQIYWLVENYGGMSDKDLAKFRDRLKLTHIAEADTQEGGKITPYTQEPPSASRSAFLAQIKDDIYRNFGAFDAQTVQAGSKTATEINAAYQALDQNADDFEYQLTMCIRQLLALVGVSDDVFPTYKRNRISNQLEQVQMLMLEAEYLDRQTILENLPNIYIDKVPEIMARLDEETEGRFVREDGEDAGDDE